LFNVLFEASARPVIECDRVTINVTQIDQPLPEGMGAAVRFRVEHPDMGNVRQLLRPGGMRRGHGAGQRR
jgi:hypothetical protein